MSEIHSPTGSTRKSFYGRHPLSPILSRTTWHTRTNERKGNEGCQTARQDVTRDVQTGTDLYNGDATWMSPHSLACTVSLDTSFALFELNGSNNRLFEQHRQVRGVSWSGFVSRLVTCAMRNHPMLLCIQDGSAWQVACSCTGKAPLDAAQTSHCKDTCQEGRSQCGCCCSFACLRTSVEGFRAHLAQLQHILGPYALPSTVRSIGPGGQ